MSRASLLQETVSWMDTVDLALCLFIYEVCNDYQFEFASGSDFVNFMNLKPTSRPVTVRPKENLRVCYMVLSVSQTIPSPTMTNTAMMSALKGQPKKIRISVKSLTKPSKMQGG